MRSAHLLPLAFVATFIGLSQAQCVSRPYPIAPPSCYDDVNALLVLAKAIEKSNSNDINSNEIINKLINALIYTTTQCGGGKGGSGGLGGTGGLGGSGGKSPAGSGGKSPLLGLELLTNDDLVKLLIGDKEILNLNLAKGGGGGGAVSQLLDDLL